MKRPSRRNLLQKAAYVAPAILTFQAAPAFAKPGSVKDKPKPKERFINGSGSLKSGHHLHRSKPQEAKED